MQYTIESTENPHQADITFLTERLSENANHQRQLSPVKSFAFWVKDKKGKLLGGINGITYYGCLYIDQLWLPPALRGQGLGSKLINMAEQHAQQQQCQFATVNTMDFEARGFYLKLGYTQEFVRHGYQNNASLYFFRKDF